MTLIKQALEDDNLYTLDKKIKVILSENSNKDYHVQDIFDKKVLNCFIWGVPKGARNTNLVQNMSEGDFVLFGWNDEIIYLGEVYKNYCNLGLGEEITKQISNSFWGDYKYQELYFLKKVIKVSCSMSKFNTFIGYNETARFRGVSKVANATIKNLEDSKDVIFKMWAKGVLKSNG